MDVFDRIMDFLIPFGLKPSDLLYKEYEQSAINKELNTFPSLKYLNERFSNKISKETYHLMKERYYSRPPFVFFFNPNIELMEDVGYEDDEVQYIMIGFFSKISKSQVGAGIDISHNTIVTTSFQGYFKDGYKHNYGRIIDSRGDIYEGEFYKGRGIHGKGEWEYFHDDQRIEKGVWKEG